MDEFDESKDIIIHQKDTLNLSQKEKFNDDIPKIQKWINNKNNNVELEKNNQDMENTKTTNMDKYEKNDLYSIKECGGYFFLQGMRDEKKTPCLDARICECLFMQLLWR